MTGILCSLENNILYRRPTNRRDIRSAVEEPLFESNKYLMRLRPVPSSHAVGRSDGTSYAASSLPSSLAR